MAIDQTLQEIETLYSKNLQQYGPSSKSLGWTDEKMHRLRFEKLCQSFQFEKTLSVNDLGCGYGAFLDFLNRQYLNKIRAFYGYDISEEMVKFAKKYFSLDRYHFISGSQIQTNSDYSFASGIFNVKFGSSDNEWKNYIMTTLHNMNEFSSRGFAFNLLTSYVDFKLDHLFYGDPSFFFDYCKKHFSKKVTLLHDYDLWEWTIAIIKE